MIVGVDIGGHHVAAAAIASDAPGALVASTFQHIACAPDDDRATLIASWAGAIIGAARTFDTTFWDRARHHLPTR